MDCTDFNDCRAEGPNPNKNQLKLQFNPSYGVTHKEMSVSQDSHSVAGTFVTTSFRILFDRPAALDLIQRGNSHRLLTVDRVPFWTLPLRRQE